MKGRDAVRQAFHEQAAWCERLGSPFTARLCATLAGRLDPTTAIGKRVLGWPADPRADALALRLCGGLHALVRSGRAPELAPFYPPAPLPAENVLSEALALTLAKRGLALLPWTDGAPQTNEVGRSAVLFAGLLAVAAEFDQPLRLFELGASAGLNLQLDRYGYRLGGVDAGRRDSPLRLEPQWQGPPPPAAALRVLGRVGVDLDPLDPAAGRERLLAYVWPDQAHRIAALESALDIAQRDPPPVEKGDAADWLERKLGIAPEPRCSRVVFHSVAFTYFPLDRQARIVGRLEKVGRQASIEAPLAWLRMEQLPGDAEFSLRLRTWPGEDRLLAWAHPHGAWVRWLG